MKPPPIHPGAVLHRDYLEACGISQTSLAVMMNVPPRRINEIVHGKRGITADTALRLGHYFGMTPRFWMNLQARYDLETEADRLGKAIGRLPVLNAA